MSRVYPELDAPPNLPPTDRGTAACVGARAPCDALADHRGVPSNRLINAAARICGTCHVAEQCSVRILRRPNRKEPKASPDPSP